MADTFRALLVTKDGDRQSAAVTELTGADLMEGDVTIAVEHSTVNYKDGLAITGKAPIIRKFPLIPGIDLAGLFANRRLSLLKVQMQMSSMRVIGLRAKHRGEYFTAAIMREAQELGLAATSKSSADVGLGLATVVLFEAA